VLQLEAQPLHVPTHDLPLEAELILAQIQEPQREVERLHVQTHDRLQELEQPRDQPQNRREAIQQHDLQHVLRIVQHALIQQDQRALRHVRAHPRQQDQDQAPQHEAAEVAAAVAALHEEEIIRHKKHTDEKFNFNSNGGCLHGKFLWPRPNRCFKIFNWNYRRDGTI